MPKEVTMYLCDHCNKLLTEIASTHLRRQDVPGHDYYEHYQSIFFQCAPLNGCGDLIEGRKEGLDQIQRWVPYTGIFTPDELHKLALEMEGNYDRDLVESVFLGIHIDEYRNNSADQNREIKKNLMVEENFAALVERMFMHPVMLTLKRRPEC